MPRLLWVALIAFLLGLWISRTVPFGSLEASEQSDPPIQRAIEGLSAEPPRAPLGSPSLRWLAVGGGALPEFNQISIQQNLQHWAQVFKDESGIVLASSGGGTRSVQVLRDRSPGEGLRRLLGELLLPKGGREMVYEPVAFPRAAAATRANLKEALMRSLQGDSKEVLTLLLTGHGNRGAVRAEHEFGLWIADPLKVSELALFLDELAKPRPLRLVATSCYGGGFAELIFKGADGKAEPSEGLRCGLFATSHDRVASGCDPNPDRSAQQGYTKLLLEALSAPAKTADIDGDGRVSLLEAHTQVRAISPAADLPTTTSERWLELKAPKQGPEAAFELSEEIWLIKKLEGVSRRSLAKAEAEKRANELEEELKAVQVEVDRTWRDLAGPILARWPELDDPWHPAFPQVLTQAQQALRGLMNLNVARAYGEALIAQSAVIDRQYALQARQAPLDRLEQARETRTRARRLAQKGGPDWQRFRLLRSCESGP